MLNKFMTAFVKMLIKRCEKRGDVFYIKGGPAGKTVYLVRYIAFKSRFGCIYIHRFMRSDADDPHDHPWNFFTYVCEGGYKEYFYDREKPQIYKGEFKTMWTRYVNNRAPGSIAFRKATDIHQVVLDRSYEMEEIEQAPLTICLMGPRLREWGFWDLKAAGAIFTDWRKYIGIRADDPRYKGSE
jgi:hypothetical protein